jgi:small subunit ribosomal protein S4
MQLREKQKLKRIYGLLERQFRVFYYKAAQKKGITGENLLQLLERRLDNVVYKLGFTTSRSESRQFITHGHFLVNGKRVDIPAYITKVGDVIEVKPSSRKMTRIQASLSAANGKVIPPWLELEKEQYKGRVSGLPTKADIALPVNEQLVVELYSR